MYNIINIKGKIDNSTAQQAQYLYIVNYLSHSVCILLFHKGKSKTRLGSVREST